MVGQGVGAELQGLGQSAGATANAGNYGLQALGAESGIYNQGLGWEQQHIQNDLTAAGINAGVGLQQQNMANQQTGAFMGAAGSMVSMLPMLAGSDRDMKKNIEPTNVMVDGGGSGGSSSPMSGQIVIPKPGSVSVYDPYSVRDQVNVDGPVGEAATERGGIKAGSSISSGFGSIGPDSYGAMIDASNNQADAASRAGGMAAGGNAPQAEAIATKEAPGMAAPGGAKKYGIGDVGATPWSVLGKTMQTGAQNSMGSMGINPVTGQSWFSPPVMSDKREKESLEAVEATPGYSFDYKDPDAMGATSGKQFGVMAQDLEKTPAGRSVVHEVGGRKMVDTSRLTMVNTAAMNALTDRLSKIEARIGGKKAA
jgi:hypothetical protein